MGRVIESTETGGATATRRPLGPPAGLNLIPGDEVYLRLRGAVGIYTGFSLPASVWVYVMSGPMKKSRRSFQLGDVVKFDPDKGGNFSDWIKEEKKP